MKILLAIFILMTGSAAFSQDFSEQTRKVNAFLEQTEPARIKTYCVEGTDDCRTLYQRRDKETKELSLSFFDKFTSRNRNVESVCYLIYNESTELFEVYSDLTPDGIVEIDQELEQNKEVVVQFDDEGYPKVENLVLSKLGTDTGIKGTMYFGSDESYVTGNVIQLETPEKLGDWIEVHYEPVPSELDLF